MSGASGIAFAIFCIPFLVAICGWLMVNNDNWFLKLSDLISGIIMFLCIFFYSSTGKQIDLNAIGPVICLSGSVFMIGFIVSIFTGIGNALQRGSSMGIGLMLILGIAFCCTGIGLPLGAYLCFKAAMKGINNKFK